jgi:Flp pilus assembly protein TadG
MFGRRKESGQALIEYALVLPLFLMVLCATIDCAWIGYQYICFDYSYREASWELSVADGDVSQPYTLSGWQASTPIIQNMEATALGIDRDNLSVDNASIYQWSDRKTDYYPGAEKGTYEKKENYWRYMQIVAKLKYQVYPPTPVGQVLFGKRLTYTKMLDKLRLKQIKSVSN